MSLQRGQLALNLLETEVTTENAYADDRTHYVAFYSDARGYVSWRCMGDVMPMTMGARSAYAAHPLQGPAVRGRRAAGHCCRCWAQPAAATAGWAAALPARGFTRARCPQQPHRLHRECLCQAVSISMPLPESKAQPLLTSQLAW